MESKIDVSLQTNYHVLIIVHHNVAAELILKKVFAECSIRIFQ